MDTYFEIVNIPYHKGIKCIQLIQQKYGISSAILLDIITESKLESVSHPGDIQIHSFGDYIEATYDPKFITNTRDLQTFLSTSPFSQIGDHTYQSWCYGTYKTKRISSAKGDYVIQLEREPNIIYDIKRKISDITKQHYNLVLLYKISQETKPTWETYNKYITNQNMAILHIGDTNEFEFKMFSKSRSHKIQMKDGSLLTFKRTPQFRITPEGRLQRSTPLTTESQNSYYLIFLEIQSVDPAYEYYYLGWRSNFERCPKCDDIHTLSKSECMYRDIIFTSDEYREYCQLISEKPTGEYTRDQIKMRAILANQELLREIKESSKKTKTTKIKFHDS